MSFPLPRFLGTAVTALTAPAPAPAAAGAPPATTADAPSSAAPAPNLVELSMRAAAEALAAAASSGDPTRSATLLPRAREPMPIDAPPGGDTSPKRARTTDSAPAAADVAPKEALPSERGPREAPTGAPVAESARRPPGVDARRAPPVDPRRPSPAPPTDPRRDFRVDARAAGARRSYSPARSLSPRRGDKRTRDDLVLRDDLASFKRSRDDLVVRDDLTSFKRTRDEGSGRYNANSRDRDYRDPRDRDNRDPRDRDFRDSRDRAYRGSNASFAHHDPRARDVPAAQPATAVQPAAAQPATTAQPAAAVQPAAAQPVRSGSVNLSLETKVLRIVTDKLSVAPSTMDALMECAPLIMDLILSEAKVGVPCACVYSFCGGFLTSSHISEARLDTRNGGYGWRRQKASLLFVDAERVLSRRRSASAVSSLSSACVCSRDGFSCPEAAGPPAIHLVRSADRLEQAVLLVQVQAGVSQSFKSSSGNIRAAASASAQGRGSATRPQRFSDGPRVGHAAGEEQRAAVEAGRRTSRRRLECAGAGHVRQHVIAAGAG